MVKVFVEEFVLQRSEFEDQFLPIDVVVIGEAGSDKQKGMKERISIEVVFKAPWVDSVRELQIAALDRAVDLINAAKADLLGGDAAGRR